MARRNMALVVLLSVATLAGAVALIAGAFSPRHLASFRAADGTEVRLLSVPRDWLEPGTTLQFEVWQKGRLVRRTWLGLIRRPVHELRFAAVELDARLTAIFEQSRPNHLLVIYDPDTGAGWPFNDSKGGDEAARTGAVGQALARRVREATGNEGYTFGYYDER